MRKFRTWKQMQKTFISSSKKESLDSFFKEELPDSRKIVRDAIKEKSIIDFRIYRSYIFSIIKERGIEKNDTRA